MLLIRHASAGDRDDWVGDDRLRPLDARGLRQAESLVWLLAPYEIDRLFSSPYIRCVQTVEPLARARSLHIETRDELGEEQQSTRGVELVRSLLGTGAAVSCHGGLSELVAHVKQKKGETLVLAADASVVAHIRADS